MVCGRFFAADRFYFSTESMSVFAAEETVGTVAEQHVGIFAEKFHTDFVQFIDIDHVQFCHTEGHFGNVQSAGNGTLIELAVLGIRTVEVTVSGQMLINGDDFVGAILAVDFANRTFEEVGIGFGFQIVQESGRRKARRALMALPIPRAPPVTSATLPSRRFSRLIIFSFP